MKRDNEVKRRNGVKRDNEVKRRNGVKRDNEVKRRNEAKKGKKKGDIAKMPPYRINGQTLYPLFTLS